METMEHLLQRKEEGRGFYHRMGAQSGSAGIRKFFGMLAEDEMRQERVLLALRRGTLPDLEDFVTLDEAKGILRRLSLHQPYYIPEEGDLQRLATAMEFEARCAQICREIAAADGDGCRKELFLSIAAEEEVHFTLLEQMREVVGRSLC
ncbi:ferritin family protein [Geomesophilobacter sediminis]|uniref:Ferritin n=1 Tax=Geomesophilobacter sediminis TaxID=2798584 RepID=A0A8J7LUW2_9BACT|nr:ferritin [Geomesophilobacter sediminis]MBJ6725114.1 ferritin [Geomesophilobacter sediminis]